MRLNNRKKAPIYQFFFTLSILIIVIGLAMSFLHFIQLPVFGKMMSYGSIAIGLMIYTLLYLRGRQIFEYDSDGEALNFKNYSVIPFIGKEARDEFPKYKLLSYEVVNGIIFKKLYVKISSKKKHHTTLSYDISYLTNNEIRDIKLSLDRAIKNNKNQNI